MQWACKTDPKQIWALSRARDEIGMGVFEAQGNSMGKGPVTGIRREGRQEMPPDSVEVDDVSTEEEKGLARQVSSSWYIEVLWAFRSRIPVALGHETDLGILIV